MNPTILRLLTLVLAGIAYACSSYLTGSGHDGLIAVAAALLGWTLPMPAQVSKRPSVPPVALVFAVLLMGCGANIYDSNRTTLNTASEGVTQLQPAVLALCDADPGERCDHARTAYEVAAAALAAAHDANEVYRATGEGLAAAAEATSKALASAREVADAVR